jgi:surfactin synthase thioesterase subunit
MKYICFHGFLGAPSDFKFLEGQVDYIGLDLDEYLYLSASEIAQKLLGMYPDTNLCLVGYSFGARMAMKVFLESPSSFTSIYLLAGHAGLFQENKIFEREEKENKFIEKIKSLTPVAFNQFWNGLELFKHDDTVQVRIYVPSIAADYFKRWGLSKQGYLKEDLLKYHNKVNWYFGEKDPTYFKYAKEELAEFNVGFIEAVGHRLIASQSLQNKLIEDFKC